MDPTKIVLADDHTVVRSGIRTLLENENDLEIVGEAANGEEAIQVVRELKPDLLIIDIRMPIMNGLDATKVLSEDAENRTKALILSMHDDEDYILQAVESGASGYLLKDTSKEEFIKAIHTVREGGKYFSGDISKVLVNQYLNLKKDSAPKNHSGHHGFDITKREKQILAMIADGMGNKEIADNLGKSIRTIETHRFNIMKKLKVNNVVELLKKVEDEPGLKAFISN
ncbi:response regulator transcription factor [Negadavirga shengliensis]|uniref:Response regulator n=1 Tax=Negadavirga shengliensis TaxID=1389218 RepID=A0ABV9T6T7_9BACT